MGYQGVVERRVYLGLLALMASQDQMETQDCQVWPPIIEINHIRNEDRFMYSLICIVSFNSLYLDSLNLYSSNIKRHYFLHTAVILW